MGDDTRRDGDGSESELHIEVAPLSLPPPVTLLGDNTCGSWCLLC
jgi:hypothetical protein